MNGTIEKRHDSGDAKVIVEEDQGCTVGDDEAPQGSVITLNTDVCEAEQSTTRDDTVDPSEHGLVAPNQSVSLYDGEDLAMFFEHAIHNVSLCLKDEDDLQLADISDDEDSVIAINTKFEEKENDTPQKKPLYEKNSVKAEYRQCHLTLCYSSLVFPTRL